MIRVPTFYIMHLEKVLSRQGLSLTACLEKLGLRYENYTRAGATMASEHITALINTIVDDYHITAPGTLLGEALQLIHHGPFGLAVMNSPTVLDIISLFERFITMRVPAIELHVLESQNEIIVTVHDLYWSGNVHQFFIDALISALLNLHQGLVNEGNSRVITRVMFDYLKQNSADEEGICDGNLNLVPSDILKLYGQGYCAIVLNKEKASRNLVTSDKVSFDYAVMLCERERADLVADSAGEKLRRYLRQQQLEIPTLESAANALYVSKRTLHRQLARENTSFRQERDGILMRQALNLLFVKQMSVKQTAFQLGYTEPANFRRAFVKYYGCSPSTYRELRIAK